MLHNKTRGLKPKTNKKGKAPNKDKKVADHNV